VAGVWNHRRRLRRRRFTVVPQDPVGILYEGTISHPFRDARRAKLYITDKLEKHELYQEIAPSSRSKSMLTEYAGTRCVESKLGKVHYHLVHFGNRGMQNSLADTLTLSGIATRNLRIRFQQKLMLNTDLRNSSPHFLQDGPPHLDKSCLALLNSLAKEAVLNFNIHNDIRALPKDNCERFLSHYYEQQQIHNKLIQEKKQPESVISSCMCQLCGPKPGF